MPTILYLCVPTEKPGKPGDPEVVASTSSSITLEWSPPTDDGGCKLDGYVVEYRPDSAFQWQIATSHEPTTKTTFEVKHLMEGTSYEFRIAAQNKAGVGPYAFTSAPIVAGKYACEYYTNSTALLCIIFAFIAHLLSKHVHSICTDGFNIN